MSSSFDFCSEHIWRILNKTEVVRVGEYCEGYPRPHSLQTKFPHLSLVNILLPAFSLAPDHPSPLYYGSRVGMQTERSSKFLVWNFWQFWNFPDPEDSLLNFTQITSYMYNFYTRSLQFLLKLLFKPKPKEELSIKIVR